MKKFKFIILITFGIISQLAASTSHQYGGISVATADNVDATILNPGGLGINRGNQSASFIPIIGGEITSAYTASRSGNFGYSLYYQKDDPIFSPYSGSIGFGTSLFRNFYAGASWNKNTYYEVEGEEKIEKRWTENSINIGSIYRPFNFFSFGDNLSLSEDLDKINWYRAGIAFRPFLKHRLTVGTDAIFYDFDDDNMKQTLHPFISIEPLNGVNISASSTFDDNKLSDVNVNIGFNFGHGGAYASSSNDLYGFGFTNYSQQSETVFHFKKKDYQHYVRMKLEGKFIEEKPKKSFGFNLNISPFSRLQETGTQLKEWIDEINELTADNTVHGLIIDLGSISAGFAKRNAMRKALQSFKDSGKKLIVYSEYGISNMNYFLISMADEIYMPEMTSVDVRGLALNVTFFRGLLDTLSIVPEVFRVNYDGKSYKTAGDSFLNREMSDEMRENYTELFSDLFDVYVNGISQGRQWDTDKTLEVVNSGPYIITQDAINAGLVTGTMYPDQFENYVKKLNDEKNTITKWSKIDRSDEYTHEWAPKKKDKIAVIYAVGGIMSGESNPGPAGSTVMGDKTIMKAVKSARENKDVKAVVLRIDSGGGSALASDHMWREIYKTTTEDTSNVKPFIASMSDVAASGGYYIACEADSILADEATITGSIGVIGLRLNFSQLLKRIGINQEGMKFADNADFGTSSRLVTEEERSRIQASINDTYVRFKDRVIEGRENIAEGTDLDPVALGRVFTGERSTQLDLALVDKVGGLHDAIEVAKNAANLSDDVEIVEYPQHEDSLKELKAQFEMSNSVNFGDFLPTSLKDEWEYLKSIEGLMDENSILILPYKIDVE